MALYEVGDIVEYESFDRRPRLVKVTARYRHDVKNGQDEPCPPHTGCTVADRAGFDGVVVVDGTTVWGYDSQLTRVWRATAPLVRRG